MASIGLSFVGIILSLQSVAVPTRALHLKSLPPIRRGIAAMPRIANPANDAQRRINASLNEYDLKVRKSSSECRTERGRGDWTRTIATTMGGPDFLSFVIHDDYYCGGVHPDSEQMAVVFDITTGAPVDWRTLLPTKLTGTIASADSATSTKSTMLYSVRLFELYLSAYRAIPAESLADSECPQVIAALNPADPPPMYAWLDSSHQGVGISFDLNHATWACVVPIVLPLAVLRTEGVSARLLTAMQGVHPGI